MISIDRRSHVARAYAVLAHLDLGQDAASLYRPDVAAQPWVAPLLEAYRHSAGRLALQGMALLCDDEAGLRATLADPPWDDLRDAAGRTLCAAFTAALDGSGSLPAELLLGDEDDDDAARTAAAQRAGLANRVIEPLAELRAALWREERACAAPPLRLLDAPALGYAGGVATHGRALALPHEHRVAVALATEPEQLLCQILHEEIHPVTDDAVRARFAGVAQDTAAGSDGYLLHAEIERVAVTRGGQLLARHMPELGRAYRVWRGRHGV